jgi:hypothetical protein
MREEKILIRLFRKVADLIGEEAGRNPDFAAKLDSILLEIRAKKKTATKKAAGMAPSDLPDVFGEWKRRQPSEFVLWLRDQPLPVLRGLIKVHELDASKRASKWKDTEKLAHFIAEQMRSRTSRGSAFLVANPPFSSQ